MKIISILTLMLTIISCNTTKESKEKNQISLENTTWIWQHTTHNSEKIEPKKKDAFAITFNGDKLRINTDCNTMGGTFSIQDNNFELGMLMATKMYCKNSQENTFSGMLSQSKTINWNEKELYLESEKTGTMFFIKK